MARAIYPDYREDIKLLLPHKIWENASKFQGVTSSTFMPVNTENRQLQ